MRSERICSLARYALSLPVNAAVTAGTQWLERTLDDSANRRLVMAQTFLSLDAILELYLNVADGLVVYEKTIRKHIMAELPFMSTEVILMECVKAGGDRQELHELIREHSMDAARVVKEQGGDNDLIGRIKAGSRLCRHQGQDRRLARPRKLHRQGKRADLGISARRGQVHAGKEQGLPRRHVAYLRLI